MDSYAVGIALASFAAGYVLGVYLAEPRHQYYPLSLRARIVIVRNWLTWAWRAVRGAGVSEPWRKRVVIGEAVLYLGDCLAIMPNLDRVNAVITDPPYGVSFEGKANKINPIRTGGYEGEDSDIGPRAAPIFLSQCDRAVVFPGSRLMWDYPRPYELGCVYCPGGAGMGRWGFTVIHPILYYGIGLVHTRQSPSGFESFEVSEKNGHPCPKPIGWMKWAVAKCTLAGQTVLDPFMGSGTTAVACAQAGVKFTGIELEDKYFDIACERIENAQRQTKLFADAPTKPQQLTI